MDKQTKFIKKLEEESEIEMNKLEEGVRELNRIMKKLDIPEEILEREVKPFGNASHIILPEKYRGKKAKIIIKK